MPAGRNSRGYTIVEVLIFMAVSGMMFLIAANFVQGKQAKSEFRQGMNNMNSQVQSVINDVSNGFFPSTGNIKCVVDDTGGQPDPQNGNVTQGANEGCVFLGKVIQFGLKDSNGDATGYNVYSVIGRQFIGSENAGLTPTTFAQAKPKVAPQLTDSLTTQWGLRITKMKSDNLDTNAIGIFNSLGKNDTSGSTLQSGSQSLLAVPIDGTSSIPDEMPAGMITSIEGYDIDHNIKPNTNIVVCFDQGTGSSQFGSLTIGGGNGQRLTTFIKIGSNAASVGC